MLRIALLAAAVAAEVVVPPSSEYIEFDGRVDRTDPAAPIFGWSASGFRMAFTNSSYVKVTIEDQYAAANFYHVWIDGVDVYSGVNTAERMTFPASVFDSSRSVHVLRVAKRSEVMDGGNVLRGVALSDGGRAVAMPAEWQYKHRIEFIGDSSACGYGVLGQNSTCEANLDSLDGTSSYPAFVAEHFNAQLYLQCWSGIGMFMNVGAWGPSEKPMPYVYKFTTTEDNAQQWALDRYHPEAIVLILGSNDYSGSNARVPTDDEFIGAWLDFSKNLLTAHPDAHLFCGTMSWNEACKANVQYACEQLGDRCTWLPMVRWWSEDQMGCNEHPNVAYERTMADTINEVISSTLGW